MTTRARSQAGKPPGSSATAAVKQRRREQVRREQHLLDAVLAAQGRLDVELGKRDAAMAIYDAAITARRDTLAEAIADYLHDAGVGIARAAAVLDRPEHEIARLLRARRRADTHTDIETDTDTRGDVAGDPDKGGTR
jgi:hypothetical protein